LQNSKNDWASKHCGCWHLAPLAGTRILRIDKGHFIEMYASVASTSTTSPSSLAAPFEAADFATNPDAELALDADADEAGGARAGLQVRE
jgi:hypothetical protein